MVTEIHAPVSISVVEVSKEQQQKASGDAQQTTQQENQITVTELPDDQNVECRAQNA